MTAKPSVTAHKLRIAGGIELAMDHYQADARDAVVVICHGFFQSKSTRTFRQLSRALAEQYDVLAFDFRGHGDSSGLYTFSALENEDLEAVLAWTGQRYSRSAVIGFSLGAAVAINVLARRQGEVRTLIAISAPSSFEEIEFQFWTPTAIRTGIRGLERGAGCRPGSPLLPKERPIDSVGKLAGLPILFIHGSRDAIVSARHSERLFAAAAEPKRLEIVDGGDHAEALFRDDPATFTALLRDWLEPNLGATTSSAEA